LHRLPNPAVGESFDYSLSDGIAASVFHSAVDGGSSVFKPISGRPGWG
jgi:hypothetical protein